MGFISAFANFGSIGSTTKWAIKGYDSIKSQNKKLKPNQAYITHISHLMGFHNEIEKTLPEGVSLAYDNLKITSN